jgi:hypothetical protein
MLGFWRVLESLVTPAHCSDLPPPPGSSDSSGETGEDDQNKQDPIIFDESESPMLA